MAYTSQESKISFTLKLKAAAETAKLIGMSTAIAFIVAGIFYTVPTNVIVTGLTVGVLLFVLHMIYEFKLEGLAAAEKSKEVDNNSKA